VRIQKNSQEFLTAYAYSNIWIRNKSSRRNSRAESIQLTFQNEGSICGFQMFFVYDMCAGFGFRFHYKHHFFSHALYVLGFSMNSGFTRPEIGPLFILLFQVIPDMADLSFIETFMRGDNACEILT
jgi:hypothetical protein